MGKFIKVMVLTGLIMVSACSGSSLYSFTEKAYAEKRPDISRDRAAAWKKAKQAVKAELRRYHGRAAIVIKDLETGWGIDSSRDLPIPSASLVKIPIMMSYFYAAHEGKIDLSAKIILKNSQKWPGSGILKNESAGSSFTIEELLYIMVTHSDNTATNILIDILGADTLNDYFKKIGLVRTNLSRKMMDFKARRVGAENFTTAGDMAHLLEALYCGRFINPDVSKKCLDLLASQKVNDRIPKRLPGGTLVAHKTGLETGICHDVGIVYTKNGNFLIVALTKHNDKAAGVSKVFIANLSFIIYSYFSNL